MIGNGINKRRKYLGKQGYAFQEKKRGNDGVVQSCEAVRSPETVAAIPQLKAKSDPAMCIPCRAVLGEQNLKITFRPSFVLHKYLR